MAGKSDTFENDLLKLIFNATAITGLAQNHATPYGNLFVALHSTSLADDSAGTTAELSYANYARQTLSRSSSAWTVNGSSVSPAANISFDTLTEAATTVSVVAVSINDSSSGAGKILYYGNLSPSFTISTSQIPIIASTSVISED